MAGFGRSNSLSINTGGGNAPQSQTAPQPQSSGGLFGATQQPQSGSLFGAKPAASQPQSGGLFGASTQPKPSLL